MTMCRVSWMQLTPEGPRPESVNHPTLEVAATIYRALLLCGVRARLWDGNGKLMPALVPPSAARAWDELLEGI